MPYADLGDITVHYLYTDPDSTEDKSAVVFLHGFSLDHRMWASQVEYFRHLYRVIVPDSRGHGLSDAPRTNYSRANRVQDLLKLLDYLKLNRIHLVGLSMGGVTAIGFALKHPDRLNSLTLVDTSVAGFDVGKKIRRIDQIAREKGVEAARQRWLDMTLIYFKKDKQDIRELLTTMIQEHSGAIWLDPMRGQYTREKDLDQVHLITIPTKIFVGKLDKMFLPLAETLHQKIRNSTLIIYENVGHMLNLEAPDRFNDELKAYLEELDRD